MAQTSPSPPHFLTVTVKCPHCNGDFNAKVRLPEPQIRHVICLKCGHKWTYKGNLKHRIRCPKCGSSQNDINRKTFGKWR